jgi:hypothetical protein
MVGLITFIVALAISITLVWTRGIDNMKTNYPDYKGEDLFDEEDKNSIT